MPLKVLTKPLRMPATFQHINRIRTLDGSASVFLSTMTTTKTSIDRNLNYHQNDDNGDSADDGGDDSNGSDENSRIRKFKHKI